MSRAHPEVQHEILANIEAHSSLLLAVSGGLDSVVLLHACNAVKRQLSLQLEVAHLDHGLRPQSASDAAFVGDLAAAQGLQFHLRRVEPPPSSDNIESWGREQRYAFFAGVIEQRNLNLVATAHHADDVAETLLMRLFSNREPGELMRRDPRRRLVRPLLKVPRAELENYAREHGLRWVEDETNQSESFLRNRVRRSVMPLLREKFDPRITEVLSIRAEGLAEDASALDAWASSEASRLEGLEFGTKEWLQAVTAVLRSLEPAVQWRLVRDLLRPKLGSALSRARAQDAVTFVLGSHEGFELPGGVMLRRRAGGLILVR